MKYSDFFEALFNSTERTIRKDYINSPTLQLSEITVNADYHKKWNIGSMSNFLVLTRGEEIVRNTLYRVGGLGQANLNDRYFMLIKYVEAYYPDNITRDKARKPHLANHWCILDREGNEKVVFDSFKNGYLVKDSPIYHMDSNYYNIEDGELYCRSSNSMESSKYVFLDNKYDDDKSRRGIMQISKEDGSYDLIV